MHSDDHPHVHRVHRSGWLRAAVLGANDGLVSTASLVMGVAAAQASQETLLLTGVAGLVAGSMSMAAGEYVSVSSQADTVRADLETERQSLRDNPNFEHRELVEIYEERGLDPDLAEQVAQQLMAHDALEAHARDELGLSDWNEARPGQAAVASALAFALGAALPLLVIWLWPTEQRMIPIAVSTLAFLAALGVVSAKAGGAPAGRAALRVFLLGGLAMAVTSGVGALFGVALD